MTENIQRWYRGYRCVGNAQQLVHHIGTYVRNHDLGRYIPVVRLEKRARGQFYFFVAVESPAPGDIPKEAEPFFDLPFLGQPLPTPFRLEDIRPMVSGEMDVQDYARRLPYRAPAPLRFSDPFDAAASPDEHGTDSERVLEDSQANDHLLTWLSAVGRGSWGTFRGACHALGLDRDGRESQRLMRKLRLLGHAETSRDGTHWSITPSVLARVPLGDDQAATYLLCGARDSALIGVLRKFGSVEQTPQDNGAGPSTVALHVDEAEGFRARIGATPLASRVLVTDDAALRLAQMLPPIDGWIDLLDPLPTLNPYMYDCRRFDGEGFREEGFSERAGFYEIWPPATSASSVADSPAYTAFYDARTGRWVRGDWYGMRFLAHTAAGRSSAVEYDARSRYLGIPSQFRWPELYERVLVLASGRLPSITPDRSWLTYQGIDQHVLEILRARLSFDVFSPQRAD